MLLIKPPIKSKGLYTKYSLSQQNIELHIEVITNNKTICNNVMTLIHTHLLFTNVAYSSILAFAQYLHIFQQLVKVKLINNGSNVDLEVESNVELYLSKLFN
jgi:hypothetical protein